MRPLTFSKLCLLAAAEAPLEGDYTTCHTCHFHCQNGQGGDLEDDRLPKTELWWAADRGAEAKGKKKADLTILKILSAILDPHLKSKNIYPWIIVQL